MKKVTYHSRAINSETNRPYIIEEYSEASNTALNLRAMALNWDLISIEEME